MSEINYFNVFIICSDNMIADIDHLYSEDSPMVPLPFFFPSSPYAFDNLSPRDDHDGCDCIRSSHTGFIHNWRFVNLLAL
jgi:hypothetical protein